MNLKEIKEIIALMNENGLTEIEIEREGLKVKLKKSSLEAQVAAPQTHYAVHSIPAPKVEAPAASAQAAAPAKNTKDIKSPMVGTF
jgi:acetyl-CoA carboxylase biotin carboxyl carrier protein